MPLSRIVLVSGLFLAHIAGADEPPPCVIDLRLHPVMRTASQAASTRRGEKVVGPLFQPILVEAGLEFSPTAGLNATALEFCHALDGGAPTCEDLASVAALPKIDGLPSGTAHELAMWVRRLGAADPDADAAGGLGKLRQHQRQQNQQPLCAAAAAFELAPGRDDYIGPFRLSREESAPGTIGLNLGGDRGMRHFVSVNRNVLVDGTGVATELGGLYAVHPARAASGGASEGEAPAATAAPAAPATAKGVEVKPGGGALLPLALEASPEAQPPPTYYLNADLTAPLPLEAGSVGALFSEHFIEHVPFDAAVEILRECRRLLRVPGSRLLSFCYCCCCC